MRTPKKIINKELSSKLRQELKTKAISLRDAASILSISHATICRFIKTAQASPKTCIVVDRYLAGLPLRTPRQHKFKIKQGNLIFKISILVEETTPCETPKQ